MLDSIKSIHFIGVGGIGMSGLAKLALQKGIKVSGSDLDKNIYIDELIKQGLNYFQGHDATHVKKPDLVIITSAIPESNPELVKAKNNNLNIIKRSDFLEMISKEKEGIFVVGTHGKTTSSSILTTLFITAKTDPTYVVGGEVTSTGSQAGWGNGRPFVAEIDESDGSFLKFKPSVAVVTNIDWDHMSFFGSKENLMEQFINFININCKEAEVLLNIDDEVIKKILPKVKTPYKTLSLLDSDADFYLEKINVVNYRSIFNVYSDKNKIGEFDFDMMGDHNLSNVLGAIAAGFIYGIENELIISGIKNYSGVKRRSEKIGSLGNKYFIDDYGHHPTEISKTIRSLSRNYKSLCVFFEPHRYSRTRDNWESFLNCYDGASKVFFLPIFSANEKPIDEISSEKLVKIIGNENFAELIDYDQVKNKIIDSDYECYLSLGAGPISYKFREILKGIDGFSEK